MDVAGLGVRMELLSGGGGGRTWCYDYDVSDELYFEDDCVMDMSPKHDDVWLVCLRYDCLRTCDLRILLFIIYCDRTNFGAR